MQLLLMTNYVTCMHFFTEGHREAANFALFSVFVSGVQFKDTNTTGELTKEETGNQSHLNISKYQIILLFCRKLVDY